MTEEQRTVAVQALNSWLSSNEAQEATTTAADWNINPFEDAILLTPAGRRRSNRVYLVRGVQVIAFAPSTTSFDEAYAELKRRDA